MVNNVLKEIRDRRLKTGLKNLELAKSQIQANYELPKEDLITLKPDAIFPAEAQLYAEQEGLTQDVIEASFQGQSPSIQAAQLFRLILKGNFFKGHIGKTLNQRLEIVSEDLGEDALNFVLGCFAWGRVGRPPYETPANFLKELGLATLRYNRPEQWLTVDKPSSLGVICGCLLALVTNEVPGGDQLAEVALEHLTVCQTIVEGHALYLDEHVAVVYHPKAAELVLAVRCWDCFWSTAPGVRETPVPLESWLKLRSKVQTYRGKPLYGEARTPQSRRLAQALGVKLSCRSGLVTVEPQRARGFG